MSRRSTRARVAWLGLASPQAALDALRALEAATDRIEGFEILPQESLDAVLDHIPGTRAPLAGEHPWHVLVEATADGADARAAGRTARPPARAADRARPGRGRGDRRQRGAGRGLLAHPRQPVGGRARRRSARRPSTTFACRSTPCRASWSTPRPRSKRAFPGTTRRGFGHLGDGNIHFHVRAGTRGGAGLATSARAPAVTRLVHDLVTAAGGSISAEHGIGEMKSDELERLAPERVRSSARSSTRSTRRGS